IRAGEAAAEGTKAAAEDLIPKLVRGLLAHRKKGHWGSTQENVFILLALDKYFGAYESVTPNFVTRIWLGDTYAGEQAFKGRSVDSNQLNIPMSYLVEQGGTSNLILDRQGAGRLYYRIGMKYAPTNLKLDPADYGFTVLRKYEAVDDPSEVVQNADGSWTIKAGARVRVRLTMVAQARRYHVALVDSLPAGLEILNPGLAVTEAIPPDTGGGNTGVVEVGSRSMGRNYYWWRANWFEHQNFRDERAQAFASLLWEGVYNYTYVTRATTPGPFVVPPATAEEMYAPETFGRHRTAFVTVEPFSKPEALPHAAASFFSSVVNSGDMRAAFFAIIIGLAVSVSAQTDLEKVVAAERAFASAAGERGVKAAFLDHMADGAVLYMPDRVIGKDWWRTQEDWDS